MANVPFILCCLCVFLSEASAKLTDDQRATLLQAHNFYRASVSPSAADMQAMVRKFACAVMYIILLV